VPGGGLSRRFRGLQPGGVEEASREAFGGAIGTLE